MTVRLADNHVGWSVSRPTSPGSHLWWDRLRGTLADLAVQPDPPGRERDSGAGRRGPARPALYDHTPRTLRALGRVHQRVTQPNGAATPCIPAPAPELPQQAA